MDPALIIFDCDGVLIDSELIGCRADAACFAEIGIAITAEEMLDRYMGMTATAMCADIARRHGRELPGDFLATMHRRVEAAFERELVAMAGIEALLGELPQRRCVASSSAPARLRHSLTLVGLLRYFEPHVFSAAQVARGKPAPDLFLFAASSMGVAPADCVVIEDSPAGVQAAVAAGIPAIGFTGGGHCRPGHAARLTAAGAVAVAGTMREVPALIAKATRPTRC